MSNHRIRIDSEGIRTTIFSDGDGDIGIQLDKGDDVIYFNINEARLIIASLENLIQKIESK